MDTKPLEKLFADDVKNLNLVAISDFLVQYIAIDRSTQELVTKTPFRKLSSNLQKLEVLFLATKARKLLLDAKQEEMSSNDIIKLEIMPEGSVKGTIKRLFDDKRILKNEKGYYLPLYRVDEIINFKE